MPRLFAVAAASVIAAGALVASTNHPPLSAATTAMAEPFWRCPMGYAFETSGSAVHCKKPAWTETRAFMPCIAPTPDLRTDLVNHTDMCAGTIGITVSAEPLCYPTDIAEGFTKRRVSGRDFCGKSHPAEIIAPNTMISF